jgi:hypothetical protein
MRSADLSLATALMDRFGVEPALIGDVLEQRRAGRSRAWFWRQVVVVLFSAVVRDLAAHPLRSTIGALLALVIRHLAIRAWSAYEPAIDMKIGETLLDVMPLHHTALLIVVSWVNAI